jgi:glycosyltransferase involved in cell wall biosynthesis
MKSDPIKRIKIGILANELFDTGVGRMGGFGWAVQQVSRLFANDSGLGVDVVIIMAERMRQGTDVPKEIHGSRVLWRDQSKWTHARRLRSERFDLLLSIDYRPNFRFVFSVLPRVPIVVWVRDPWDNDDRAEVMGLRIPGQETEQPNAVRGFETRTLRSVMRLAHWTRRPILFAVTTPFLAGKVPGSYGVHPDVVHSLPNIIDPVGAVKKSDRPSVVSLARLDPVKRPWVIAALAQDFPDVEFLFMGQRHFEGKGSWQPENLPPNVRLLGHVDEEGKKPLLSAAWLLVNTSIHEGLSVSFLEALACETPIVACLDPEAIVSRYGRFVGNYTGTGMDALPSLRSAVRELITDNALRQRLGAEGRSWVCATHSRETFLAALAKLFIYAGVDARAAQRLTT